jgi:hypothetical protein
MSELIELLKRWADLEPDKCKRGAVYWYVGSSALEGNWTETDFDKIQGAVQRAIVAHDLRFCLENAANGIYFAGVRGISPHSTCYVQDQEPAIALLRAYLGWLEPTARRDVA